MNPVMVTADHGLAGVRYAENYFELHHFHLDLRDVKAFAVCGLSKIFFFVLSLNCQESEEKFAKSC